MKEICKNKKLFTKNKKTIFGNVGLTSNGNYQVITSEKEGNNAKLLHRLVYEDFHKVTILPGVHCHHIDGDSFNNDIENLELMYASEHMRLHQTGKFRSLKTGEKMSKTKNSTGFLRVVKMNDDNTKQGFRWYYRITLKGKRIGISSVNIETLKEKVVSRGFPWKDIGVESL